MACVCVHACVKRSVLAAPHVTIDLPAGKELCEAGDTHRAKTKQKGELGGPVVPVCVLIQT